MKLIDAGRIERSERELEAALIGDSVHNLRPADFSHPGIPKKDLYRVLYEEGLVDRVDGRRVYDQILGASPNRICPLCGMNQVSSLDHHLPKTVFPTLCVSAINLVPACADCNHLKGRHYPSDSSDYTLHPYFDNAVNDTWLRATVVEGKVTVGPPHLEFTVEAPRHWSSILEARAKFHLLKFELRSRYALAINSMLSEQQQLLGDLHSLSGSSGVRSYLIDLSESALAANANSFRGVAFRAMSRSDWFCAGGYQF